MFCQKCGSPLNEQDKFCSACGTPIHGKKKKFSVQLLVFFCLLFCLAGAGGTYLFFHLTEDHQTAQETSQTGDHYQEDPDGGENPPIDASSEEAAEESLPILSKRWDDPDELVAAYLQELKKTDVDDVIALCDIPEQLKYVDYGEYLSLYFTMNNETVFISDEPLIQQLAECQLKNTLAIEIRSMWSSLFAGRSFVAEGMSSALPKVYDKEENWMDAETYVELMRTETLREISYAVCWVDTTGQEDRVFVSMDPIYGGNVNGYREYLVLLNWNGSTSIGGITLYQYQNEGWKIHELCAPLSGYAGTVGALYEPDLEGMSFQEAVTDEYGGYIAGNWITAQ